MVGCATLTPERSLVRQQADGAIELVVKGSPLFEAGSFGGWVVCGRYWRTGVGQMLFEHARDTARAWGMRRLMTSTYTSREAALAAFRRFGLTEWGRLPRARDSSDVEVFFYLWLDDPSGSP